MRHDITRTGPVKTLGEVSGGICLGAALAVFLPTMVVLVMAFIAFLVFWWAH